MASLGLSTDTTLLSFYSGPAFRGMGSLNTNYLDSGPAFRGMGSPHLYFYDSGPAFRGMGSLATRRALALLH